MAQNRLYIFITNSMLTKALILTLYKAESSLTKKFMTKDDAILLNVLFMYLISTQTQDGMVMFLFNTYISN